MKYIDIYTCQILHIYSTYSSWNTLFYSLLFFFKSTKKKTASNVPLYVAEFATKSAAKSYGKCGDIVKSIAQAMNSTGGGTGTKVGEDVENVARQEGRQEGMTALSFFQAEDESKTGVLSYVHFSCAIEKMSKIYSNILVTEDEMERLFRCGCFLKLIFFCIFVFFVFFAVLSLSLYQSKKIIDI